MNHLHITDVQSEEGSNLAPTPAPADNALAMAIKQEAQRRGIEIGDDPELLAILSRIAGEEQIPREFYVAIAAVLTWVDGLK
jgi:type III secretion system FlhB-like substrate exporter